LFGSSTHSTFTLNIIELSMIISVYEIKIIASCLTGDCANLF